MGLGQESRSSVWTFILVGKLRQKSGPMDKTVQLVKGKGSSKSLDHWQKSANCGGWGIGRSQTKGPIPQLCGFKAVAGGSPYLSSSPWAPNPMVDSVSGGSQQGVNDTPKGINRRDSR